MKKTCFKIFTLFITALTLGSIFSLQSLAAEQSLEGKTALFIGDSIAAGWRDDRNGGAYENSSSVTYGRGWSRRLRLDYGLGAENASVAGASFKRIDNRARIVEQLHNNKSKEYDYVIMEGGFNDAMGENKTPASPETATPVGKVSSSFSLDDFDTSTFAGALEELFYYAKSYFDGAKLGFIITYSTPLSKYGGYTANAAKMKEYWDTAKQICDKWDIAYLDLFSGKAADGKSYSNDILKTSSTSYFPGGNDQIHLNSAGYDVISPYIAEWMKTLNSGTSQGGGGSNSSSGSSTSSGNSSSGNTGGGNSSSGASTAGSSLSSSGGQSQNQTSASGSGTSSAGSDFSDKSEEALQSEGSSQSAVSSDTDSHSSAASAVGGEDSEEKKKGLSVTAVILISAGLFVVAAGGTVGILFLINKKHG